MGESVSTIRGWVRNGVIIPEPGTALPDGAEVRVALVPAGGESGPTPFTPEEEAEFAGWDKIGDEAWSMIDWGEGEIARDSG